ncbi:C25 family cysteine peptidase [Segetibacter koreensis]|uniref:putative type IX secretion system sortase PorU2 n=1 Tax=Segetibacter koreensis TaxID=398037 RepID=UPI00037011DB|nr:C25 family cysteine peptidase [Segetibacter koreensis]
MKRFFVFIVLIFITSVAICQSYYNEWIDYNKTYYKFKVGSTGLYRINSSDLNTIGLANEAAQSFQLWRNGKEVPLYTSAVSGALGVEGYLEFWGEKNDGVPDRDLYKIEANQLSDRESLLTDTAAFFLTINPAGNNLRFLATANNVAGNTIPAEPWFMFSARNNFKNRINRGMALVAGSEYVYSSTYDQGEMWSSQDIYPASPLSISFTNLHVASSGPAAIFSMSVAGNAPNQRDYTADLNSTQIIAKKISSFEARIDNNLSVPLSALASSNATIKISNKSGNVNDRIVCGFVELSYPRQFNFDNQSTFAFSLAASVSSKYLEISNFNSAAGSPVLYDLTNFRRYVADVSAQGKIRFVVLPSSAPANFVIVSQAVTTATAVTAFQRRTFTDFRIPANQGDYLIITHPSLQTPYSGANQVDQYRAYRSSVPGGSFNAKIYDVEQLTDQFGYGIKKNPMGIRNFLRFARTSFSVAPKYAFLIGRGLTYAEYRENELNPNSDRLNLVPTFGYPASDILLASNSLDPVMNTLISRISVLYPRELADYLDKVKQYEQAQQNTSQTIESKAWMKNVVHVVGANDANLDLSLSSFMRNYESIIEDTLYGATVTNFNKTTTGPVTPIVNSLMSQLFQQGISLLNYFGHSSASSLDYNLDDPAAYNNTGKYPMFLVGGCNAGNLYSFDTSRFSVLGTLSERYVLAKNKGAIGFIASTHFGIDTYLDYYNRNLYRSIGVTGYGKSITYNMNEAIKAMNSFYGTDNIGGRLHAEETTLDGDPALKMNSFPQPDFVVEEPQIRVVPNILSVADNKFTVKVQVYNIGKAAGDSVSLQVKHIYPNGTDTLIFNKKIRSIRYIDSVSIEVPIVSNRDKGENKISVSVDVDNKYAEINELNNTSSKTFTIFEDELTPVYPYNFSIVNHSNIKLSASTANPLVQSREYLMEMDTTELFNSPFKVNRNTTSVGGLIEFDPGVSFTDSTVYYWRVAPATSGAIRWNTSSFVYLAGSSTGFNQSHFFQHTKSSTKNIEIDSSSRKWKFSRQPNTLTIVNSIFPVSGDEDSHFSISVNGILETQSACLGHSVIFNVFDPITLKPLYNQAAPSVVRSGELGGFMKSAPYCKPTREFNFEFSYMDTSGRRKMRDFIDWIPAGYYVTARLILDAPYDKNPFVGVWKNDAQVYGAGNTLYDRLKTSGFSDIDSYTYPRTWAFIYRKNNPSFQPVSKMSNGLSDRITLNTTIYVPSSAGTITSPQFGPAKAWKQVQWRGSSVESRPRDVYSVNVIGITSTGREDTLYTLQPNQQDFSLTNVNPLQYPYIRLSMKNQDLDTAALTPYQLRYWRLLYDPVPEGAIAPNINYRAKDTLEVGERMDFSVAFKNIADAAFPDSLKVKMVLFDKNNVQTIIPVPNHKNLKPGDTTNISYPIDTKTLAGNNTLYIDVNPDNAQPEQYHFNNFLYKNFFVKGDTYNPLMDVTFDGVHILNGDIVSARPKIVIKLKDESKYLALDDTSLTTVFVRYPGNNGATVRYAFGTDTVRFIPADLSTGKNEATIEFSPAFLQDSEGDFYELIVKAKDKSGNSAGNIEYRVSFQVYNKPMISNMFNYPNPFTTSTAFVFTVTGSDVPQNIRIQIMTITGKIVKEITKLELGPLHIGRNITEYKWDGTDQYGQRLANGVYLYRVITNLNGASLDKFNTLDANGDKVDTDKFFNKGYGKMYLMR